jgi:hypothetical protein
LGRQRASPETDLNQFPANGIPMWRAKPFSSLHEAIVKRSSAMVELSNMGAANGHARRSDILHLPWRDDRRNCRPRLGACGIGADGDHVPRASGCASKVTTTFDANRPRERSLAKQLRTETQLLDLVWAHVERFHRGPLLDGAQFIRVIRVANDPNRNWRIATAAWLRTMRLLWMRLKPS